MIYKLQNENIMLHVKSLGAELTDLSMEGHSYLWKGDRAHWSGQSPVLFPVIGGQPDNAYTLGGQRFEMAGHGFARKKEFLLTDQGEDSLTLTLSSDDETMGQYPFRFDLSLIYTLEERGFTLTYRLNNHSDRTMPFSLGGHPAFNCPLEEGLDFTDYQLVFSQRETSYRRLKGQSLLTGQRELLLDGEDRIELTHALFDRGALILDDLQSERITLLSPKGTRRVTMDFAGFPYFGIWKRAFTHAPFICLEPWYGVDSTEGDSGRWEEKEGLETLDGGGEFTASFTVTLE